MLLEEEVRWDRGFFVCGVFVWIVGGLTSLVDFERAVAYLLIAGLLLIVGWVIKPLRKQE